MSRRRNRQYQDAPPAISNPHYDMGGNLIGGYAPDGTALGTKRELRPVGRQRQYQQSPQQAPQQQAQMPIDPTRTARPAQGAAELQGRQQLFKDMEKAGFNNLDDSMRERARKLGVDDTAFNNAATRLRTNEAYTPKRPQTTPTAPSGTGQKPNPQGRRATNPLMPDYIAPPESRIDGMPAEDAIVRSRNRADAAATAMPLSGQKLAQKNVETMGIDGAIADFKRRNNRAYATPPPLD